MATATELQPLRIEDISTQPPPLQNEVTSIEGGIGDDCKITFKCNDKPFVILLSRDSPVDSVERSYLNPLNDPLRSGDEESSEQIFEELVDLLAGLCQPVFREFAAIAPERTYQLQNLYSLLYLEVIQLRLVTTDGIAILHLQEGPQISTPYSFRWENPKLPVFEPSKIDILDTLKSGTVFKALIKGTTVCAKVLGHQGSIKPIQREIRLLQQIAEVKFNPRLRTSTLFGLVSSEDDSSLIIGLLIDYIDSGFSDLSSMAIDSIPQVIRGRLAKQISDDIGRLHRSGLVWGDAKAGNIVLDKESNPWIIDFGGGSTVGWVDADLADSVPGDLQGLRQILKFLQIPDL